MWCSTCGCLARPGAACPECGRLPTSGRTAAAALLGLSLAGCDLFPKSEALYGATITDTPTDAGDADTDTDTDTDAETGDTGG